MHIPDILIWGIMSLYKLVRGKVCSPGGLSNWVDSTIGVKQGCPLSPTLFGLYINEITSIIDCLGGEGALLADLMIQILLYANDIVLLSSSVEGLQRHLDALEVFYI